MAANRPLNKRLSPAREAIHRSRIAGSAMLRLNFCRADFRLCTTPAEPKLFPWFCLAFPWTGRAGCDNPQRLL